MFIRYPGSKAKLRRRLLELFPEWADQELWSCLPRHYAEPFFGSGAIGWFLLKGVPGKRELRVTVNDLDMGIANLWLSVRDCHEELKSLVLRFKPSLQAYYEYKEMDGMACADPVLSGFRKLALHQMSFSGLGYMSGGPIGGASQSSAYNVDCRWSRERIVEKINESPNRMHEFRSFEITCRDFTETLASVPDYGFVYLDPPYYEQGPALYRHSFTEDDHRRLASCLRQARFRWLLSYDDHEFIRTLYEGFDVESFLMTPTTRIARDKRRKNQEILIRNR